MAIVGKAMFFLFYSLGQSQTPPYSGGPDLAVIYGDQEYDKWANCFVHNKIPNEFIGRHISEGIGCRELVAEGLVPAEEPKDPPPVPGAYRVKSGVEQRTRATRTGVDISNCMRLTDKFAMILSANA